MFYEDYKILMNKRKKMIRSFQDSDYQPLLDIINQNIPDNFAESELEDF